MIQSIMVLVALIIILVILIKLYMASEKTRAPFSHPVIEPLKNIEEGEQLRCVIKPADIDLCVGDMITVSEVHINSGLVYAYVQTRKGVRKEIIDTAYFERIEKNEV